jgi:hypothetical protein
MSTENEAVILKFCIQSGTLEFVLLLHWEPSVISSDPCICMATTDKDRFKHGHVNTRKEVPTSTAATQACSGSSLKCGRAVRRHVQLPCVNNLYGVRGGPRCWNRAGAGPPLETCFVEATGSISSWWHGKQNHNRAEFENVRNSMRIARCPSHRPRSLVVHALGVRNIPHGLAAGKHSTVPLNTSLGMWQAYLEIVLVSVCCLIDHKDILKVSVC